VKEEELIKKFESIDLPRIEVQSHRRRLRVALLNSEYFKEQPEVGVFNLAKSRIKGGINTMKGLFSRRPVWKPALVSTLAIALIVSSALFVPSLVSPSAETLAADIAKNSPEVRALIGGERGEPVVLDTKIINGTAYVLCSGRSGESAISIVDVANQTELQVAEIKSELPQLSDEEKAKAIKIVKANSKAQELLSNGGTIAKVVGYPMPVKIKVSDNELTLKEDKSGSAMAHVIIVAPYKEDDEAQWDFYVDLDKEKVVDIVEPIAEKPILKPEPVWTGASWEELIDIAKTNFQVQELFDQGAKLVAVGTSGTADTAEEAALTLELDEEKWIVRIDLANRKVTKVELVPQVEPGERVHLFDITEKP
jgi:hypothetical protein